MFYLIPAWYKNNSWNESEQPWHSGQRKSEYDDTVKQVQLFHRRKLMPYQVMILGSMPNLRQFLHRQGLFKANYWSCFDAICEIKKRKMSLFSYRNLKWPEGIEFENTPFVVMAYLNGNKYAQIDFGADGNMIQIDMFKDGKIIRRNIYDDRGFVSRSTVYENGQQMYCEYYMENGIWKLREYYSDGHVEVNPKYPNFLIAYNGEEYSLSFERMSYSNLEEIITEVTSQYVAVTSEDDIFCFAMQKMHLNIMDYAIQSQKMILSFYENRLDTENDDVDIEKLNRIIGKASYIITDSVATTEFVKGSIDVTGKNLVDISPYDSRKDFGISLQMALYKVLVPVDELQDEKLEQIITISNEYMAENERVEVHFFTRKHKVAEREAVTVKIKNALVKSQLDTNLLCEKSDNKSEGIQKFFIDQCVDEMSVNRCIKEQRILVDLRDKPEQYLQIAAISAGIPQIVNVSSEYIEDGYNGIVLEHINDLSKAFHYYLDGLANWNEAMIYAYRVGEKYSTKVLLDKWKEVIRTVEQG